MHELALMDSVMDIVRNSAVENHIERISKVKLVIGRLSMALPDSMRFAFEAICGVEELFQGAVLEIEEKEVMLACRQCQKLLYQKEQYIFSCSDCGSNQVDVVQGRELYLDYFEGE